jgi:hypothetical protein
MKHYLIHGENKMMATCSVMERNWVSDEISEQLLHAFVALFPGE